MKDENKKRIVFFGDSNTYGFDPRDVFGGRYDESFIWSLRLAALPEWDFRPEGQNGREIPHTSYQFRELDRILQKHKPIDCFAVMLGTNDLLMMYNNGTAEKVATRMDNMIKYTLEHPVISKETTILLAAPPFVDLRGSEYELHFTKESLKIGEAYEKIAEKYGIEFIDTAKWKTDLAYDGVHLSEKGHLEFAENMKEVFQKIIKL